MKNRIILTAFALALVAGALTPAGAAEKTATYGALELYNNDDMNGTTSVTLTHACTKVTIKNVSVSPDARAGDLLFVMPDESSPSTSAHYTIFTGEVLVVETSDFGPISSLRFWSNGSRSIEILTERKR